MTTKYNINIADETRNMLKVPAPDLQAWRGKNIEKILLQQFATCDVCLKSLEKNAESQEERFDAPSKIIQAMSEIKNDLCLYIPVSKTYPSIDAVLVVPTKKVIIFVQATVSVQHPIKLKQLHSLHDLLKQKTEFENYDYKFVFVVSNDIFDNFKLQSFLNENGKVSKKGLKIPQYAAKILPQVSPR
jgi:hypothetical protein